MLLVVGSVALDSVETPFGAREDALGGSATYFAAAASLLAPVHVVGVVGDDFPLAQLDFLRARGVHLDALERVPGRTFRWKGRYGYDLNAAQTLDTQLNVFERFEPRLDAGARQLAGESNVIKAAAAIERMGARAVCIKRGEYGALLVSGDEAFFAPA